MRDFLSKGVKVFMGEGLVWNFGGGASYSRRGGGLILNWEIFEEIGRVWDSGDLGRPFWRDCGPLTPNGLCATPVGGTPYATPRASVPDALSVHCR